VAPEKEIFKRSIFQSILGLHALKIKLKNEPVNKHTTLKRRVVVFNPKEAEYEM